MQGGAYVSIYLHHLDYAEFFTRQAEEAEADRKTQGRKIRTYWLRNTPKFGRLELSLLSLITATPFLRKNGMDLGNHQNILIKVENTQEHSFL